MASPDGGGTDGRVAQELGDAGRSGSQSPSSGESSPGPSVCRWRNDRFHEGECSRYFDCPTHVVERAVSDPETDRDGDGAENEPAEEEESEHGDAEESNEAALEGDTTTAPQTSNVALSLNDPANTATPEPSVPTASVDPDEPTNSTPDDTDQEEERRQAVVEAAAENESESSPPEGPQRSPRLEGPPTPTRPELRPDSGPLYADDSSGLASDAGTYGESIASSRSTGSAVRTAQAPAARLPRRPLIESIRVTRPILNRPPPEIVLPRWQPDAEVTYCPICHTQFSIFVRKHHCRKCGRVVCGSCSPHRILIPHQYVVQPPGSPPRALPQIPSTLIASEGAHPEFSSLGGGERVRLCNPCVPDPNTTPPRAQESPTQRSHQRSQSTVGNAQNGREGRLGPFLTTPPSGDALSRSRSVTMHSGGNTVNSLAAQARLNVPHNSAYRTILSGSPGAYNPSAASSSRIERSLPPPPPLAEEDECPVCHRELPSRALPNFEALREAHISICITAHSTYNYGGSSPGIGTPRGTRSFYEPEPPLLPRRTGMFPYAATEKDCVDSAECTICLEEFEVGVPMARLECLCRFHRACISAWFVNHPGRCPVHQHDSFGY